MNTLRPRVIASTFSSAFWVCALCVLASVFIGATSQGATVGFRFLNNTGGADTNTFRVVPIDTVLSDGSVITKGIPIRLTPNASGYAQTNLMVGDYFVTNAVLARGYTIRVPNDLGGTIYCGTCSTEDASTNLAISGLNRFITIRSTNAAPTSAGITNALGFLPLTPTQTTNAALQAALNATNGFGTIVRSNYTDYILTNALPGLTNGFVTASITNSFATTNFAKSVTNGMTSLATTNPTTVVYTNVFYNFTNGATSLRTTNADKVVYTNQIFSITNGFVSATVTNGLSGTNYVVTAINAATNQMATRAYVASATNALGSAAFRSVTAFQPANATLTNLALTGAYTNIPLPGSNVTFSTNSNGQVTISASTNGSGGVSVAAATRTTAATNGVVVSISAVSQTNNFTSIVLSNASIFYPMQNISNYATATDLTNRTIEVTNGFGTIVRSNATVYVHTNALVTLTNKFATTNYSGAINLTNNANRFGNITTANITNSGTFTTAGNVVVTAGELSVNGQVTAQTYVGNAGDLTNYNANQLADGPIPLNVISGLVASNIDATTWSLATNLNGGNAVTATNVTSFITNRWRSDITSSNLTLVTSNDTRAFNWTNTSSIYAGIVTNGNISTTNFLIGPNRIFQRETNAVAMRGSGTAGANGTYYWNSTRVVYTNELSGYYLTNIATIWYMETAASVIQYSSSGLETNAWTQVNGSSTLPTSSYGTFFDTAGTVFIGPLLSTNVQYQITNYSLIRPTNSASDNYIVTATGGATKFQDIGTLTSNYFIPTAGGSMTGTLTNNSGYYGDGAQMTNVSKAGSVVLVNKTTGQQTRFGEPNALSNAVAAASSGDTILAYGNLAVSNAINISEGMTLKGSGATITSWVRTSQGAAIGLSGNSPRVENVIIQSGWRTLGTYTNTVQLIGCDYTVGQGSFTNAILTGVNLHGDQDGFFIKHTNVCSLKAYGCVSDGGLDVIAIQAPGVFEWSDCSFKGGTNGNNRVIIIGNASTNIFFGGTIEVDPDAAVLASGVTLNTASSFNQFVGTKFINRSTNATPALINLSVAATAEINGCTFENYGTNSAVAILQTSSTSALTRNYGSDIFSRTTASNQFSVSKGLIANWGGNADPYLSTTGPDKIVPGTTNLYLGASASPPVVYVNTGGLVNSNKSLYWVTATKTNLVSDGN